MPSIRIRLSGGKGRGLFAEGRFNQGDIIAVVSVVVLPDPQYELLEQTALRDYYFYWDERSVAVAMGAASFCNYSAAPNAEIRRDLENNVLKIVARQIIHPGEEITVTYHCNPWFKVME